MKLYEEFVSRQEIFHGRIVDLRVDTVRLPNGHLTTREVIDHPGGVAVVAIDENDNVLTVKPATRSRPCSRRSPPASSSAGRTPPPPRGAS